MAKNVAECFLAPNLLVSKTSQPRTLRSPNSLTAKELAYELSEFLSRKFPNFYRVIRKDHFPQDMGWYGDGEIKTIEIIPLKVTYDLDSDNPMMIAGLL